MNESELTASEAVQRCQEIFAHAWMVRTFVKHSPEAEEFPELMQVARTVFDVARSLESRVDDPPAYFRQLQKKWRKLREAVSQFRQDAPLASDHTNFKQAVISLDACLTAWERTACSVGLDLPQSRGSAAEEEVKRELDSTLARPDDDTT